MSTDLQAIILTDIEEHHAPPEMDCLQVGYVDGIVFLAIGQYEETAQSSVFIREKTIAIEAVDLSNAVLFAQQNEINGEIREENEAEMRRAAGIQ